MHFALQLKNKLRIRAFTPPWACQPHEIKHSKAPSDACFHLTRFNQRLLYSLQLSGICFSALMPTSAVRQQLELMTEPSPAEVSCCIQCWCTDINDSTFRDMYTKHSSIDTLQGVHAWISISINCDVASNDSVTTSNGSSASIRLESITAKSSLLL